MDGSNIELEEWREGDYEPDLSERQDPVDTMAAAAEVAYLGDYPPLASSVLVHADR